jgi:beta-glucanase (GH16 family)
MVGKHKKKRRWTPTTLIVPGALGGVFLLLALTLSIVNAPASSQPNLPTAQATTQSLNGPATTTTGSCNGLAQLLNMCAGPNTCNMLAELLNTCAAPAPGDPSTTPAASCNELESALGLCGAPATTTTTTTSTPPTTTTTTSTPPTTTTTTTQPVSAGDCSGTSPPIAPPTGSWACTLDDEFNGTTLNSSIWQPQLTSNSGFQTGPLLSNVCYVNDPSTISVSGGYLNLSVEQVASNTCGTSYDGGMVTSYKLFSQEFGYFQVRAEMPPTAVPGLQETLWLYPENETLYGAWPNSGEIDYGEFYSEYPDADIPAVHYPGSQNDPNATTNGCTIAGDTTAGQFNVYGLSWTPTTITTYFNGVPCTTDTYGSYVSAPDTAPEPFNQPFFLAFTSAFGLNGDSFEPGTTPLPATTKIDYARVWQYG